MRIDASPARSVIPSQRPVAQLCAAPMVSNALLLISNSLQVERREQPVGLFGTNPFAIVASRPPCIQPPRAAVWMPMSHVGAQIGTSDNQSFGSAPKRMKMDAPAPATCHEAAPVTAHPRQLILAQSNAVANAPTDPHAACDDIVTMPTVRVRLKAPSERVAQPTTASPGAEQASRSAGVAVSSRGQQSEATIAAVHEWRRLSASDPAKSGSLYAFLTSQGLELVAPGSGRALKSGAVTEFEWVLRLVDGQAPQGLPGFLGRKTHYVRVDGTLSALGTAIFRPILEQAGLSLPQIEVPVEVWEGLVRPLIERWCDSPVPGRKSLLALVDTASPAIPCTPQRRARLAAADYYVMHQHRGQWDAAQEQRYRTLESFARAPGGGGAAIRNYVLSGGVLGRSGRAILRLLPARFLEQASHQPRTAARGQHAKSCGSLPAQTFDASAINEPVPGGSREPHASVSEITTASHGTRQSSWPTGVARRWKWRPQSVAAINALDAWRRLSPPAREKARSLYDFLISRNAMLTDCRGRFLSKSVVAQFEWMWLLLFGQRPQQDFTAFLHDRDPKARGYYVHEDGTLSARGAATFGPILQQAGLEVRVLSQPQQMSVQPPAAAFSASVAPSDLPFTQTSSATATEVSAVRDNGAIDAKSQSGADGDGESFAGLAFDSDYDWDLGMRIANAWDR